MTRIGKRNRFPIRSTKKRSRFHPNDASNKTDMMVDSKYGPNEANRLYRCSRCADEVPVFIRKIISTDNVHGEQLTVQIHCRKCDYHGHPEGSLIESITRENGAGHRQKAAG